MTRPLNIAVVGSGISGLAAAWLLSHRHRVTLFERDGRAGGHSNTIDAPGRRGAVAVDTGFIVYNTASYPNLIALLDHLGVATAPTSMGFAVSLDGGRYEYSGSGLRGILGQPSNALNPSHWRMVADILRFFREAPSLLEGGIDEDTTLGDALVARGYSRAFIARHILPMAAAIWSTPAAEVLDFPAAAFVRFFSNHGLLQVRNRPQWRTVTGGSRTYVRRMLADMSARGGAGGGRAEIGNGVTRIARTGAGVVVTHARGPQAFDACVVATHADEALALLDDADSDERRLLGAFRYKSNRAVLHRDPSLMPRRRNVWASWNYLGDGAEMPRALSLTYWMNRLQPLCESDDLFVTLNPARAVAAGATIAEIDYAHPLFDRGAMAAQRELWRLQGARRTWFCGSYFGYGFHEDGLQAALAAAEDIGGVRRPWRVAGESARIHRGPQRVHAPLGVETAA